MVLLLAAPTPRAWLATHLLAHQAAHDDAHGPTADDWVDVADLLADGAAVLRRHHARLVADDGATPQAAAKWLAAWFPGGLADSVGFTLATASAALLVQPGTSRFRMHPGGWPDRTEPGPTAVAVPPGHPWAGQDGVTTLRDEAEVAAAAVSALSRAAEPLVEACRGLARVGRNALWAEVADGFGLPVLHQLDLPVDAEVARRLQRAVHTTDRPWRKVPDLRVVATPAGRAYVGRKGGCCLAYQSEVEEPDPAELTAQQLAYHERFPHEPGEQRYCSTCSLRDLDGCEQRQLFWLEQERERLAHDGGG